MSSDSLVQNISTIEKALIEHITIYGLTTRAAWPLTCELKQFTEDEISGALRSLTKKGIIQSHPLHHGRFYFVLRNSTNLNAKTTTSRTELSERDKIFAFARLMAAVGQLHGAKPVSLKVASLLNSAGSGAVAKHLLIHTETHRAYYLRVDVSIVSSTRRTAIYLKRDVLSLQKVPSILSLAHKGQLEIVLVTCAPKRADIVLRQFSRLSQVGRIPVRSIVLPDLVPLFFPVPLRGIG